ELERCHALEQVGGRARLYEWSALAPATANAAHYAREIVEKARRRYEQLLGLRLQRLSQNGGLDSDEALQREFEALLGFDSATTYIRSRRKESALPFGTLADMLADVPAEPEWAWHGYLARGTVTLLAGRPKVGKSTLLFGLAA